MFGYLRSFFTFPLNRAFLEGILLTKAQLIREICVRYTAIVANG